MLNAVIGELMLVGLLIAIGLVLYAAYWLLGGGLMRWEQERRERRELAEAAEEEVERVQNWDAQRAAELAGWLRSGALPATVMRTYPAPEELSWDWARLRDVGYRMDHDPVVLTDGQLMVNYSLQREDREDPPQLRVVGGELPPPPPR